MNPLFRYFIDILCVGVNYIGFLISYSAYTNTGEGLMWCIWCAVFGFIALNDLFVLLGSNKKEEEE